MKLRILVMIAVLVGTVFVFGQARASAATTITPEIIERIKTHCVDNQSRLNRLHKTDAFLRTERGNVYRTISDKLMVPLNRRLAANQLDGGALLTITADYNDAYTDFYDAYIDYDNALSKVLEIDCSKEPVSFYNALLEAREKRAKLSAINQSLKELVRKYGVTFTDFKTNYEKENQ